ncbi:MAG: PilW family protein, partial [Gammaproteobacteria bacterium]|nr:PilW family protein [Gammaproteobacteria bacterium]
FNTCITDAMRLPGTDILVVRHAQPIATPPAAIVTGRLYLIANVMTAELFVGGTMPIPPGYSPTDAIHEVVTNAYYVSRNSSAGAGIPALNRLQLGAGPTLANQELIAGVEDLQVQLGIDTDDDGSVNSYVSPGSAALAGATVTASRAWIRVRGERIDFDYTDTATYQYADLSVSPNDSFRRMLLTKTLRFRNDSGT